MKEFIMRGKTADFKTTGEVHTLNFSGHKGEYGFRLVEFMVWPSTNIGTDANEICGSITAGKTVADPENPNFDEEGLIGTALRTQTTSPLYGNTGQSIVNDTFIITQDLILSVTDTGGTNHPINWQCKFIPVKLSSTEAALTNYRQFSIFDE
jgi:hypothetical protein